MMDRYPSNNVVVHDSSSHDYLEHWRSYNVWIEYDENDLQGYFEFAYLYT